MSAAHNMAFAIIRLGMSIFSKLFRLFITVVLLPLIPMALLLAYYQNRQKTNVLEAHYNLAEVVSSELPYYMETLKTQIHFAADINAVLPDGAQTESILKQAVKNYPDMRLLAVISPDGTELARILQGAETNPALTGDDLLQANLDQSRLLARLTDADGATPSLEFVYPLNEGYILYGREAMSDLAERLAQMRIGRTGQVFLVTPEGQIYTGPYQWNPGVSAGQLVSRFGQKSPIITSISGQEGTLVGAVSSQPRLGVYVVVLQPKQEAMRSLYLSSAVILLFILAIAMLAFFAAHGFARSLAEPIARLMKGAQEVSRGNLDYRIKEDIDWDEFKELICSFNKMTADLKDYQTLQLKNQVSEMKEQIFRAVAHDLRAPLLGLQGYIYILSSGQVSEEERQDYLARMADAARNLSSLLEDVLAVSRVEAGVELPRREQVEISPLVQSVLNTQRPAAQEKNLELTEEIPAGLHAYADPKLLRRIISNLVSNAVKYTEQGFVRVTAQENENEISICVQDSGIGLTEEQCLHIFEKFQQVDGRAEGYGLGLFISRQLARAHGGELTVESVPGQGSRFTLCLPKETK